MNKEASGTEAGANSSDKDKLYEERGPKTIVRLLTVGAYMFSVSFAALVLSGYYIFFWHPPNSRLIHAHASHLRADNEMDFMAADSLTVIRVDKSNQSEITNDNKFHGIDLDNRYSYVSNFNQKFNQNFNQNEEELRRQREEENRGNDLAKKMDTNKIKSNEETSHQKSIENTQLSMNNKNLTTERRKISTNNEITNEKAKKSDNSMSAEKLSQENSKKTNEKYNSLNSDNIKIFNNFLKIL
ncbi:TBC1 domain family member 5 homolog A-like [Leptopilina heterotoma]|uniref:TBC1 domain family member 5 homolog A-like n=1 Tax=Leptopilina heterotoma TaxID=63436 RepID=UPI001CAA2228|nr:TBC1 domain family member 5 homolog A-like [Leptopilina heterotoma]